MRDPKRVALGRLAPDLPAIAASMLKADNCVPIPGGYGPMGSLSDMGENAVANRPRGGISAVDRGGAAWNFVGTEDMIYEVASRGTTDISAAGGYSISSYERWAFAQFSQLIFAASYDAPLQWLDLAAMPSDFAAVPELHAGIGVPRARHLGVVKNHLILGNCYDAVYGASPNSVWWGAVSQPLSYPEIASDEAASLQSDRQPLAGDGGWVQGIIGGAEVGAIFQEKAIWRMDYRGGAEIFDITKVEPDRGLLIPGLAVSFKRNVLFLAEDGFYVFDYTGTTPVGKGIINQYFFDDWDATYPDRVWAAPNPDSTQIRIIYPSVNATTPGVPDRMLVYDWALDRWSTGTIDLSMLMAVLQPGVNLDTLPDDNLDDDDLPDFDERLSAVGARQLGAWSTGYKIGTLDGDALIATFETGDLELAPGRRALSSSVRPIVHGTDHVTVGVAGRAHANSPVNFSRQYPRDKTGKCPARLDSRYHRYRLKIGELGFLGFDEGIALDVNFTPTGIR